MLLSQQQPAQPPPQLQTMNLLSKPLSRTPQPRSVLPCISVACVDAKGTGEPTVQSSMPIAPPVTVHGSATEEGYYLSHRHPLHPPFLLPLIRRHISLAAIDKHFVLLAVFLFNYIKLCKKMILKQNVGSCRVHGTRVIKKYIKSTNMGSVSCGIQWNSSILQPGIAPSNIHF